MKDTFKYDFRSGDFVIKNGNPITVSGIDALKVWIEKILRTPLGRYKIYRGTQYGAGIEDLTIGKTYGMAFTNSELKREIEAALLQNADILSVRNITIEHGNYRVLDIKITLKTIYGEVDYIYDG